MTEEGRLQMSRGKLRVAFVAFSDSATFYERDAISGSSDVTSRVYLEATSLPQDQLTFQADDSGQLKPFRNPSGLNVISGKITSGSVVVPSDGQQFVSMATELLDSSAENFKNLQLIGTIDDLFEDELFELSADEIDFTITNTVPLPITRIASVRAEQLPAFIEDPRLSHIPNFMFLPPVIRTNSEQLAINLGHHVPLGPSFDGNASFIDAYKSQLQKMSTNGSFRSITMDPTSRDNNVFMQMFEVRTDGTMTKLDVLAFQNKSKPGEALYFMGKIIQDDDQFKFVNIFTLTMS